MALQKFRSIEEMDAAQAPERSAHRGFERFIRLNAQLRTLSTRPRPRGVFKYRSLEEAQKAAETMAAGRTARRQPE